MVKKIVVPESGHVVTNSVEVINEASTSDIQLYYYAISNTMKCYLMYKKNPGIFSNSVACDCCYQIYNVKEKMYPWEFKQGIVCEECHKKDTN